MRGVLLSTRHVDASALSPPLLGIAFAVLVATTGWTYLLIAYAVNLRRTAPVDKNVRLVVAACAWLVIAAVVSLLLSVILIGPPGLRLANGIGFGIPLFVGSLLGYASRQPAPRR
jgi:hypothetical protein